VVRIDKSRSLVAARPLPLPEGRGVLPGQKKKRAAIWLPKRARVDRIGPYDYDTLEEVRLELALRAEVFRSLTARLLAAFFAFFAILVVTSLFRNLPHYLLVSAWEQCRTSHLCCVVRHSSWPVFSRNSMRTGSRFGWQIPQ
jgi:hypothetical protein